MTLHLRRCIQFRRYCSERGILSEVKTTYDIHDCEDGAVSRWEKLGLFQPSSPSDSSRRYSMILPPPNVTGTLHLGHALTVTCQDVLARWQRMKGMRVLWVPGVDHAGIATQAVVERMLGIRPSPDELQNALHRWSQSSSTTINSQLKNLGASLHWPSYYYTLDEQRSEAVREAFLQLWQAGYVERKTSLVNWSSALGSTLSDIEVNHCSIEGRTALTIPGYDEPVVFGTLVHFAYPLEGGGEVTVATTRPETMLGDVCLCVHPSDSRHAALIGRIAVHPFTQNKLPIISDEAVDPSLGTGILKVTPAHDQTDFEIASRHNLPVVPVIGENGLMNEYSAQFQGLKRFDARTAVIDALSAKGLLKLIENHKMEVPLCSRSSDVIELLPKPQWFIKCKELANEVVRRLKEGEMQIAPDQHVKTFLNYMDNIRDWCVSRQVQWGHNIPLSWSPLQEAWVPSNPSDSSLQQDPDVLDTWFSSSLLPFSALGWPHQTKQLNTYYPLDIMITGHDIVFFWVARMAMMGLALTKELPFKKVLLHGIICDSEGRKMSKSVGNVIDPRHIIDGISLKDLQQELQEKVHSSRLSKVEGDRASKHFSASFPGGIPQCGTDALRIALMGSKIKKHFVEFDVADAEASRILANKIWQAGRYILGTSDIEGIKTKRMTDIGLVAIASGIAEGISPIDRWLVLRLGKTVLSVNNAIQNCEFHIAISQIKHFAVNEMCDIHIEWCKVLVKQSDERANLSIQLLRLCFLTTLRMLAPFAPFLSDRLYCHICPDSTSVHAAPFPTFPEGLKFDIGLEDQFSLFLELVKEIRRLKPLSGSSHKLEVGLLSTKNCDWTEYKLLLKTLTKSSITLLNKSDIKSTDWILNSAIGADTKIYIPTKAPNKKINSPEQTSKRVGKLKKELAQLLKTIDHKAYQEKVAENVKKAHQEKIIRIQTELERLQNAT